LIGLDNILLKNMKDLYDNTILIVDDSPANIGILVSLLEDFDMKTAISGEDALNTVFNDNPPDLILLDIMMPKMDGYEVCKRVRADERSREIPIIFLTAKVQKEDVLKGFELGAQDYITKPFDTHELIERVKVQLKLKMQRELLKRMSEILEQKVDERTAELNESNLKLEHANKKLLVLDEAKNEFLKLISHEIRTPLNGILGPASVLSEMIDDPQLRELFDILNESVQRLEEVSKLALEITQMQTTGRDMAKTQINMKSVIEKLIEANLPNANEKHLTFSTLFKPQASIRVVEMYFTRCMQEIIDNAIKFSNENGVIHITTATKDGQLKIIVSNTGEVIPADQIEEIVKPFGAGRQHSDEHVGLGLHYVQTFLEIHGAGLDISSSKEKTEISLIFRMNDDIQTKATETL